MKLEYCVYYYSCGNRKNVPLLKTSEYNDAIARYNDEVDYCQHLQRLNKVYPNELDDCDLAWKDCYQLIIDKAIFDNNNECVAIETVKSSDIFYVPLQ